MRDVKIKCDKGEVEKVLAYIEQIDGVGFNKFNKCYLIEVKGLEKA